MRGSARRGVVVVVMGWVLLLESMTAAHAEVWVCRQADGAELYADRMLEESCRKLEQLPPLLRAPAPPDSTPEAPKPEGEGQRAGTKAVEWTLNFQTEGSIPSRRSGALRVGASRVWRRG